MKQLTTTLFSDTAQFPVKKGTLAFLQQAPKEVIAQVLQALIGPTYDNSKFYVLYGCVNSGSGSSYIISDGAVFFFGEVFAVPATSFTTAGANVPIFSLVTTQYNTNADPVTLTDGSVVNVHDVRTMHVISGASSVLYNYSAAVFYSFVTQQSQATEILKGIAEIATQAEVNAGADDTRIITPLKLKATNEVVGSDYGTKVRVKVVAIDFWDMDGFGTKDVPHGLPDILKILSIDVIIRNDSGSYSGPLGATISSVPQGGISNVGATNITLERLASGGYDNGTFNDVLISRGYVTIKYLV